MRERSRRSSLLAGICAAAAIAGLSAAEAQTLTGSIFGAVSDSSGARLPGVTVTVTSPQLIRGRETRVTSDQGTYRVPSLPPGTYSVSFELSGFQALKREGILLLAGQSLAVDAQLELAQLQESVTVTGEAPLVDTRSSALVNVSDTETLENVPMARELTKLLNIMPGVTDGRYEFAPVNTVHGGTVRQNLYTLDGVNVNDPVQNTTAILLPVDAFQEIQITTAGITAEFGDASGALVNYVTKSGGNDFHGGANLYYQGEGTESNNVTDELRRQGLASSGGFDHVYDASALLGGPIRENRAWFFTNLRYYDAAFRRPDFRAPIATDERHWFTKPTIQLTDSSRLDVGFFFRDALEFPFGSASSFRNSADERTWDGNSKQNIIVNPRWTNMLSDSTLVDARASFSIYKILGENPNNDGSPAYMDVATGILSGGSAQADGDNRRNRHEVKIDLSHFLEEGPAGSHSFKTGFSWGITPVWYTQFLKGARGDNALELAGCTQSCISPIPDTHHLLFNGDPFRVRLYAAPTRLEFEMRKWSAYLQDQWVVRDRLTLNLGVRLEHTSGSVLESQRGGGRWDPLTVFPEQTGLIDITDAAPRVGAVWDLFGDHRTVVKGSAGRYYNQLSTVYLTSANPASLGFREFDWSDANGDFIYDPGEEGVLHADTRANPARLPTIDPDLKNQYTDVYTLGFERDLGRNLGFAVTAIFKRDGDLIGLVNEAVPFSAYAPITVDNPLDGQPLEVFTLPPEFRGRPGQLVMTNPGEERGDPVPLERRYDGLEVVLRRRWMANWQLETSYVWGRGRGNVNTHYGRSDYADYTNPNFLVNRFGDLTLGARHQLKAFGSYQAPLGILLSGYFEALSGIPVTDSYTFLNPNAVRGAATVRVFREDFPQILSEAFIDAAGEPAGTRKFDAQTRLDLRVEKRFGPVALTADVFNLFNASTVIRVNDLRLDSPQFLRPAEIQLPRQLRLGAKWTF